MKITLLVVGKTTDRHVEALIQDYSNRLGHYVGFDLTVIPELRNTKNLTEQQQKTAEAKLILAQLQPSDHLVLLDEHGRMYRSVEFAQYIQKKQNSVPRRLVFLIGGPYGFDSSVYDRADDKVSLSPMTFSHQMIRLIFVEQLYRAYTILRNEPYHHE